MTDNKYTNEDIISSLEVIATTCNCNECKIRSGRWGNCNCSETTANAALDLINHQKAEIDRLKEWENLLKAEKHSLIKAEAIKEFAERLKEKSYKTIRNYGLTKDVVEVYDIDNLIKEMENENNG